MTNHSLRVKIINRNKEVTSLRDYAVAWNFSLAVAALGGTGDLLGFFDPLEFMLRQKNLWASFGSGSLPSK